MEPPLRVLVVTTVHTPLDARIHHRQVRALRSHGAQVTYAAPWSATGTPPDAAADGVRTLDLPRAVGRRRVRALRAARRLVAAEGPRHDVVLLHDPELALAVAGQLRQLPPVVLDVHEDTASSLIDRPWVPGPLRPVAAAAARRAERWSEERLHLLLAERSYQERFTRPHPFVPNVPPPAPIEPLPPGDQRAVYVGRIAVSRGARELLAVAAAMHGELTFELIGPVDGDVRADLERAVAAGHVDWAGFVPNDQALPRVEGAAAGLSLVHPQPNHAGSLQTKVLEYLSRRVPVITTDLPVTGPFVREHDVGLTVPVDASGADVDAVVAALRHLVADGEDRRAKADRGYDLVVRELNWDVAGAAFVAELERIAETAA
ncbi:glycosyltransferase [Nitriliruptor alkaliphilus]|uniref:glycosyltransferase n=1 Tax=Nitriliruptor alkaliphilus TaxID=427918 RepID=UPI001B80A891|nr:glycosyltransferase [Nitriliruptor alkaliphilus]